MDKINNVNSAIASNSLNASTSPGNQSSEGKNASAIKVSAIKVATKLPTSLQGKSVVSQKP